MNSVKILYMNLDCLREKKIFEQKLATLSRQRQDKILSYRFEADQRAGLGAGLLLDCGLKEIGYQERDLVCEYNTQGKPYYPNLPAFHFNLSHSGQYAAAIFAAHPVGIDLEQIKQKKTLPSLSKRFFHPEEYALLETSSEKEKTKLFYQIWTLKESYVKTIGRGMSLPFPSFSVAPATEHFFQKTEEFGEMEFFQYDFLSGYCISVCLKKETSCRPTFF